MKYRAVLIDPGNTTADRPQQIYGMDYRELQSWAKLVIAKAVSPDAFVSIYETREELIQLIHKPKAAAATT